MKNKYLFALGAVILIVTTVVLAYPRKQVNGQLDAFAKCLAEKGAVMYGAEWCPHCQSEKRAFGDSFRFVPYVECPDHPQKCLAAGISGYPTWIFPDGRRLEGEQGVEKLSEFGGCALPSIKN